MTGATGLVVGLLLGGAAGFLGSRLAGGRRSLRHFTDHADQVTAQVLRAADAAVDLPPGAKLDVMVRLLANRAADRIGLPCMTVLREVDGGPIHVAAVSDGSDTRLVGLPVELDSWVGRAVTESLPVVAPPDELLLPAGSGDRRRPIRGGVAVPIRTTTRTEGAVIALGESVLDPAEVVTRLEALVVRFAPNLGPAHAVAIAERKANTDELTGIGNRRFLAAAMSGAEAGRSALVMLDLDHFKDVNDTHGHPAGDAALKHVAALLRNTLRAGDVAARVGGEEFAVWLPGGDLALGLDVAERLRAMVAERVFHHQGTAVPLTVSCGVSACPQPVGRAENLMATADAALYRAKRDGRNRVVASVGKGG